MVAEYSTGNPQTLVVLKTFGNGFALYYPLAHNKKATFSIGFTLFSMILFILSPRIILSPRLYYHLQEIIGFTRFSKVSQWFPIILSPR